ncbi:YceI family protein [Flavobacterium sufflavum]|uniref:YceI family protein n=1 Tax=Flavobacterium sufflavum TaxID=1921138 RepID=A0A3S2V145_9FLAO|nr:YceI family protein [Flavobacterium sufflavum]RVT72268.1 YceI family protein [Flavobacterium sufflavum]
MRLIFLFTAVLFLGKTAVFSQDKKITKTGQIVFEASVPSFEEVKAVNESVSCILNIKTGEIASLALMKGFRFKVALMEEHFNENYIESSKYPKAIFKGIIKNFNLNNINKNGTKLELNGKLELHGVSKDISVFAIVKKSGEDIELVSDFDLTPADFNIQIPKIVRQKIAETVHVKATFLLK